MQEVHMLAISIRCLEINVEFLTMHSQKKMLYDIISFITLLCKNCVTSFDNYKCICTREIVSYILKY